MSITTRHREDLSRDHFDLLPFINILMCTLACLLLVTLSIAALSIGPSAGEGWIPIRSENRKTKVPVLIEWDGTTITAHLQEGKQHIDISNTEQLKELIDYLLSNKQTHYALFAVRPSGFASFGRLGDGFRNLGITVGYGPIAQERSVRLIAGGGKQ